MMLAGSTMAKCLLLLLTCAPIFKATTCQCTPSTDTVYVGTADGHLAISKDEGETWTTVLSDREYIVDVSAHGDNVYAGSLHGLYVSHDGGSSWSFKNLTSDCFPGVRSVIVNEEKHVYVLIGRFDCGLIAVSSDNGDTWPINFPIPNPPLANNAERMFVDGPRIYVASDGGLGYTDDMGETWTFKNQSSGLGTDGVLSVIGRGQSIYAGLNMDGGCVSMSTNGGRIWKTVNTTGWGVSNYVGSMYLRDDTLYAATMGGGLSWSNDFTTWTTKTTADGLVSNDVSSVFASGNNIYAGTLSSGLSISRDNGRTWITKTTKDGLPNDGIGAVFVQCVS